MADGMISSPEELYKFLKSNKFRIVANIIFAGSPGHQIAEMDYFLRKRESGDIPRDGKYLWVQRSGAITETMVDVYRDHFRNYNLNMIAQDSLFEMASKVVRMVPELGVDVGLSHVKNTVMSREGTFVARFADDLYYHVTNDMVIAAHKDYFRLRGETLAFDPWTPARPAIEGRLADLLGGKLDRIAIVHFRARGGNAGMPVPAENMFPTLEYLHDCGFTIVKAGTEPYPEEFARFNVINYSESPLRSFRNDLALLSHAKVALINASGLENLLDSMGIPGVSYARWHLTMGPYSRNMVILPALLYDQGRAKLMSFAEQILFFRTRQEFWQGDVFGWHFPLDRFVPRIPQADEMLSAVQEALALGAEPRKLSPLQERFNRLDENGVLSIVKSRVSDFFLNRFETLL